MKPVDQAVSCGERGDCMRAVVASLLDLNYETYRSYEYGRRATPPEVIAKAKAALQADRQWMIDFKKQLGRDLDAKYPMGIDSE